MVDEGTEGNASSSTLQGINKISREGLNIRFLLIQKEGGVGGGRAHKFCEELALKISCSMQTEATVVC